MKLSVTGRYVDLDFELVTPVKLSQQYATETTAESAGFAIACQLGLAKYSVYSAVDQKSRIVFLKSEKKTRAKRSKLHGATTKD